jgi:hypothetical protein
VVESCDEEGEGQLEQGRGKVRKSGPGACRSDNNQTKRVKRPAACAFRGRVAGSGPRAEKEKSKTKHLLVSVLAGVDVDFYAFATGVLLGLSVAVLLGLAVLVLFVDAELFAVLGRGLRGSLRESLGGSLRTSLRTSLRVVGLRMSLGRMSLGVGFKVSLRLRLRVRRRLGTASAVFKYAYVFSVGGLAALSRLDVDGEGFLVFRVTFPPCLW